MARTVARLTTSPRFWIVVVFFSLPLVAAPFLGVANSSEDVLSSGVDDLYFADAEWQAAPADATTDGTIVVRKATYPRDATQTFTFGGDVAGTIGNGETLVQSGLLAPGSYSSTEMAQPGWTLNSIQCDDDDSPTSHGWTHVASFNLGAGETVECTFFNQQDGVAPCLDTAGRWPFGPSYAVDESDWVAFLGSGAGLISVDVADPNSPEKLADVGLPGMVQDLVKIPNYVLATVSLGYEGSLQVVDADTADYLEAIGSYPITEPYGLDVVGPFAFVASGGGGGLTILDVSSPPSPAFVGWYPTPGNAFDVRVSGSYAYVAYSGGVDAVDIFAVASPSLASRLELTSAARGIDIDGDLAYVATSDGYLRIVDISEPEDIFEDDSVPVAGAARDVTISDGYAYVSNGWQGLAVVDLDSPGAPTVVGVAPTTNAQRAAVTGPYAYVADGFGGLRVVDVATAASPVVTGSYRVPQQAADIAVAGDTLYLALGYGGDVLVLDVNDISDPAEVAFVTTSHAAEGIVVRDDLAYLAAGSGGLQVYDISTPTAPSMTGSVNTPGSALRTALMGDVAYVADSGGGLRVIDVSAPGTPSEIGDWRPGTSVFDVVADGDHAYLAAGGDGLVVIDVSTPSTPTWAAADDPAGGHAYAVAIRDGMVMVADDLGLRVVDVSDPTQPEEIGRYETESGLVDVDLSDFGELRAYAAGGDQGLVTIDLSEPATPFVVRTDVRPSAVGKVFASGGRVFLAADEIELEVYAPCGLLFADGFETGDVAYWSYSTGAR